MDFQDSIRLESHFLFNPLNPKILQILIQTMYRNARNSFAERLSEL